MPELWRDMTGDEFENFYAFLRKPENKIVMNIFFKFYKTFEFYREYYTPEEFDLNSLESVMRRNEKMSILSESPIFKEKDFFDGRYICGFQNFGGSFGYLLVVDAGKGLGIWVLPWLWANAEIIIEDPDRGIRKSVVGCNDVKIGWAYPENEMGDIGGFLVNPRFKELLYVILAVVKARYPFREFTARGIGYVHVTSSPDEILFAREGHDSIITKLRFRVLNTDQLIDCEVYGADGNLGVQVLDLNTDLEWFPDYVEEV